MGGGVGVDLRVVPPSMANLIVVNHEYAVLLCVKPQCMHAQTVKGIEEHFRKFHHEKPALRRKVGELGRVLAQRDARFLRHYSVVQLPVNGLAPQPIVPVVDGFSCVFCHFYTVSRAKARIHANKQHSRKGEEDKRISHTGKAAELVEATERRLRLKTEPLAYELDAWLNFTKWRAVLTLSKHDILGTYKFLRYPETEDKKLRRLLRAWDVVRARALDTLEDVDHKDALKWWVSPKNEVASQNPFELPQNAKTLDQYSRTWEQFLCYMARTVPALDDESGKGEDDDRDRGTETGIVYTREQREAVEDIHDALDDDDSDMGLSALASNVMKLCTLVITQDTSATKLYDSPLMHYLAVRGIDEKTESFRRPMHYTNILAGVLWIVRLLALEMVIPSRPWPELGVPGKTEVASVKKSLKSFRLAHLVEGSFSPTSSILTQLAKGKKDNLLHQSPSNIYWSEDKETIYYTGRPVELARIGPMCNEIVDELKGLISTLAFGGVLPTIELARVVDSTAWAHEFRKAGYNFTKHSSNRHLDVGYSFNLQRARTASGELQMIAKTGGGGVAWIEDRKNWYLAVERSFLRKLMVAVHVAAGQPARGPELGSIKVCNGTYSSRNIIVLNGRLSILTMYDKSRRRRGNTDYVIRVLPDDLSQLLAQYVVYVRPFSTALDMRESEYLFADVRGPWAGEQLSRELGSETTKHLGVRLTVRAWRHVTIGIAVQWLGSGSKMWEKDGEDGGENDAQLLDDDEDDGDDDEHILARVVDHIMVRQASHGLRVAQSTYAVDGAFLHRLGPQLIAAFEHASVVWHELFEWKSEGAGGRRDGRRTQPECEQGDPEDPGRKRAKVEVGGGKDEEGPGRKSEATKGLRQLYGPQAEFKSEGQASTMELVHDRSRMTNIIVLPTSAGKSALFMSVAAMCTHKSVIVVVPFVQLIADMVRRAVDCGLTCVEWKGGESGGELEQLVVVSAEWAASHVFLHYARGLELGGTLAHLFFDECHVAITDTSYRKQLRELWQLRYLNCPFTCLTATLMVALEANLRKQLMLPETQIFRRSTVRPRIRYAVVNSLTTAPMKMAFELAKQRPLAPGKKGIVYVRTYRVGEAVSAELRCPFYKATAVDKNETLERWIDEPGGGWIVATGALGTGINIEGIVEVIHVDRPYGLTSFAQQSGRGGRSGEVSNSVVITRLDGNFSSRASALQTDFTPEKMDEEALTEYIRTKGCRRAVLARHFDGDDGAETGCRERAEEVVYCDRCEAAAIRERALEGRGTAEGDVFDSRGDAARDENIDGWPYECGVGRADSARARRGANSQGEALRSEGGVRTGLSETLQDGPTEERGQETIARTLRMGSQEDDDMLWFMVLLRRNCAYCTVMSGRDGLSIWGTTHTTIDNCANAAESGYQLDDFHKWRAGIDLKGLNHCYRCGLSQDICRSMEAGTPCEFPRVMFLTLFVLHTQGSLADVVSTLGFRGDYEKSLWSWMRVEEQGHVLKWETNLMRVWRWICSSMRKIVVEQGRGE